MAEKLSVTDMRASIRTISAESGIVEPIVAFDWVGWVLVIVLTMTKPYLSKAKIGLGQNI